MNILEEIINHKVKEVADRKALYPVRLLEQSIYFKTPVVSLQKYLLREDMSGIIAEFKRRSPSKGNINPYASIEYVSIGYMQGGASALSILTDQKFFGGKNQDLSTARKFNFCPILRKDFVVEEYQLVEAKSIGADAILLIAACLEKEKLKDLANAAKSLGLEVLMEIHDESELGKLTDDVDIVGVNNRDLTNFKVDVQTSKRIAPLIPEGFIKISESGLNDPATVVSLKQAGYQGFLIGECFMKTADPTETCARFISDVNNLEKQLVCK